MRLLELLRLDALADATVLCGGAALYAEMLRVCNAVTEGRTTGAVGIYGGSGIGRWVDPDEMDAISEALDDCTAT